MLDLNRVTLIAFDNTNRISGTIKAIYTCIEQAKFGKVKLITSKEYIDKYQNDLSSDNIIMEEMIYPITDIKIYNRYVIYDLYRHVETDFCLMIQDHAFIINPESWSDEFFEYDYIGAPWALVEDSYIDPFGNHQRVGNGGFSLRSKKLLDVPKNAYIHFDVNHGNFYKHMNANNFAEDGNICVHNRHIYEVLGCKFAPVEVAARFSQEKQTPETLGITPFGFHSIFPVGTKL